MTRLGEHNANVSPHGIDITPAVNTSLSGMIDMVNHHLIVGVPRCRDSRENTPPLPCVPGHMGNLKVKVPGWRSNGDGLHVSGNWNVSRIFLRTQDGSLYITSGVRATARLGTVLPHGTTQTAGASQVGELGRHLQAQRVCLERRGGLLFSKLSARLDHGRCGRRWVAGRGPAADLPRLDDSRARARCHATW